MGLFSRKEEVGEFIIDHHANGDLVFQTTLNPNMTLINFAFYFGKTVYDLGEYEGTQLWKKLFATSTDVFNNVVVPDSAIELEDRRFDKETRFKVVPSSTGSDYLRETVGLFQKGDVFFCETMSAPPDYPQTEDTLIQGIETLFVHLFNSGPKDVKFFLPVVVMAQCNWYIDNGFPSMLSLNGPAYQGINTMMQLAQQAS